MILGQVLLALACLPLGLSLVNALTMRTVRARDATTVSEKIAVLVPMRDEAANVAGALAALLQQSLCPNIDIAVLNDHSTDETAELLAQSEYSERIEILQGKDLPAGWLGKNFACHQLAASNAASAAEYLVFVDADVRIGPSAIAAAITQMKKYRWDFISPYPKQLALTLSEKCVQPLLQWSFMSALPLRLAHRSASPAMAVANGQFFIVTRSAYDRAGGHHAIKSEVLDDLELARALLRSGAMGGVADGSSVATCRMYENRALLFEGYRKSLWRAFPHPIIALFANAYLAATAILPLLLIVFSPSHWRLYLAAYGCVVASRVITALKTRANPLYALWHFISIALFNYLVATSWIGKSRGQLTWRGRKI